VIEAAECRQRHESGRGGPGAGRTGRMRRLTGATIAAVMTLALPVAMTGSLASPAEAAASVEKAADLPAIKYATSADIDTLNPFLAILASSTGILRFQYESLVAYGKNNEIIAGLSDKWETSKDGKTWTFHIPSDRKWSDDQPLTAQDVAWTFNAVKTTAALQQANGGLVANVASVTAKDPQTVVIVLTAAQASTPGAELPIVPQHVWEKVDPAKYANDKDTVGSGPYIIKSYVTSQSVQLVPNPNFWRGAPKNGGLTYVYYKNLDAQVQALKTGEVDVVADITPAQFQSLQNQQGITAVSGAGRRYTALAMNPGTVDIKGKPMGDGNRALADLQVRTAISMAIDKNVLLTKVLQGHGKPGESEMPTVYPDFYGLDADATKFNFDPAAANALLDKAGYPKGANGIRTDKQGKPLNLRLMGRNSDPTHAQMADYIKQWMADIGIGITVTLVTSNQVNNDSTLGKYDLYFTGWGIGPDPDFQLSINRCASRPNADGTGATSENNWCDPAFDKVYAAQHTELDPAKRAALVKHAFTMINNAAVSKVIWYADKLEAYRSDKWTGLTRQPENGGSITGQNGYWGMYTAVPVGSAAASSGSDSASGSAGTSASGAAQANGSSQPSGSAPAGSDSAAPANAAANTGSGFPWWIIVVVVLLVAAAALIPILRRRSTTTADDRE